MITRLRAIDTADLTAAAIIGGCELVAFAIFVWNICKWWSITP